MNTTVAREWAKRIAGYGLSALSGFLTLWIGSKLGSPETGAAIGGAVATAGAAVVNKAIPYIIPDAGKVHAANQMPQPLPKGSAPLGGPGDILRR